jgi:hypothetical protein
MKKTEKQDIEERPLKKINLSTIEESIASAISELVESEYEASIINIDFEPCLNAWLSDTIEIKLRIKKPSTLFSKLKDKNK